MTIDHVFLYDQSSLNEQVPPVPSSKDDSFHFWKIDELICLPYESKDCLSPNWDKVKQQLTKEHHSIQDWIESIRSYAQPAVKEFENLETLFDQLLTKDEATKYLEKTLPSMAKLALRLPELLPHPFPKLRQNTNRCLHLSQQQVACLLANAFFCTFPDQDTYAETRLLPNINFNTLHRLSFKRNQCKPEKLRCILHYFDRVCTFPPTGTITYYRRSLTKDQYPNWTDLEAKQFEKVQLVKESRIEEREQATLHVDFASKRVGGSVLKHGCVQEEIRFTISTELILSRLFTELLLENEVLFVTGAEQYSRYSGYAEDFHWEEDFQDLRPRDRFGRRQVSVVAMDALKCGKVNAQFDTIPMHRELNKAFCAFASFSLINKNQSDPGEGWQTLGCGDQGLIASGNWGCGAYKGDDEYKFAIQLLAATQANRTLEFVVFGTSTLENRIAAFLAKIKDTNLNSRQLYQKMIAYNQYVSTLRKKMPRNSFFKFVFNEFE